MAHGHATAEPHKPHVLPLRVYFGVWVALIVLTYITVKISYYHFGELNLIIAMGVATVKASLVALFFMHLKYDEPFNAIIFVGSLVFLSIFFILTLADTMERGHVDPIKAREIQLVPARPELELVPGHDAGHEAEPGAEASGAGHEDGVTGAGHEAGTASEGARATEAGSEPAPADSGGGH